MLAGGGVDAHAGSRLENGKSSADGNKPPAEAAGIGRDGSQGRMAALAMTEDFEVISTYTDQQAIEDGVLIAIHGDGGVNRVTRAVFDHFAKSMGSSSITGPVTNIGPVMEAIRAVLNVAPDEGGWRVGNYQGKTLWLVPNEIGGLTLMFPEDY